jgi:hypothetical protein
MGFYICVCCQIIQINKQQILSASSNRLLKEFEE